MELVQAGDNDVPGFGFNPLNQVYVFNKTHKMESDVLVPHCFNPLNQVYVFNSF